MSHSLTMAKFCLWKTPWELILFSQMFPFEVSKNLVGKWNSTFRLTATNLKTDPCRSSVYYQNWKYNTRKLIVKETGPRRNGWMEQHFPIGLIFWNVRTTPRGKPKTPKFYSRKFLFHSDSPPEISGIFGRIESIPHFTLKSGKKPAWTNSARAKE